MNRRHFIRTATQSGAALGLTCFADAAERQMTAAAPPEPSAKPSFRDLGWVWEGQGLDPKVPPSIYGLGQGARYFGLSRANYLFHPNDVHALRLLKDGTHSRQAITQNRIVDCIVVTFRTSQRSRSRRLPTPPTPHSVAPPYPAPRPRGRAVRRDRSTHTRAAPPAIV